MKPHRRLQVYVLGTHTTVYALRDPAQTHSEPDRFFLDPAVRASSDLNALVFRLRKSGPSRGFRDRWFRDERGAHALYAPHPTGAPELEQRFPPSLRLYCLRYDRILIAGHGGLKTTATFQDDPALNAAVADLEAFDTRLQARLELGDVWYDHDDYGHPTLGGDIDFAPDDIP